MPDGSTPCTEPDLLFIGGGSGGVRAARVAAERGLRVTLVEADRIGGTCMVRGCVPKKLLNYAAKLPAHERAGRRIGRTIAAEPALDWGGLIARVGFEVDRLEALCRRRLIEAGVALLAGQARLLPQGRVQVAGLAMRPRKTLLAVGAVPWRAKFMGAALCCVSDDIWSMPRLPERIVVVGGGYIALEFASTFLGMGRRVTQVQRSDRLLRDFDQELPAHRLAGLASAGLEIVLHGALREVRRIDPDTLRISVDDPGGGGYRCRAGAPGHRAHPGDGRAGRAGLGAAARRGRRSARRCTRRHLGPGRFRRGRLHPSTRSHPGGRPPWAGRGIRPNRPSAAADLGRFGAAGRVHGPSGGPGRTEPGTGAEARSRGTGVQDQVPPTGRRLRR